VEKVRRIRFMLEATSAQKNKAPSVQSETSIGDAERFLMI
jgi:hypothetical protein